MQRVAHCAAGNAALGRFFLVSLIQVHATKHGRKRPETIYFLGFTYNCRRRAPRFLRDMFFSDVFLHKLTYFQSVNGCNRLSLQQNLRMNHLHVQRLAKLYILMPRCVLTLAQFWQKILKPRRLIESGRFTVLGNKRSSKSATKRKGESWRVLVHKSGRLGVDR
jgi:hypothetical protein